MPPRKGTPKSPEHRAKLAAHLAALNRSPEHIAKVQAKLTGRPKSEKHRARLWQNRSHTFTAEACANMSAARVGKRQSPDRRRKNAALKMGALNPNWRGGRKAESRMIRERVEAKLWREAVFARDDHTCGLCLVRGGALEAHHIVPVSVNETLRYELSNGMTLCLKCHRYVTRTHRSLGIFRKAAA